MPAPSSTGITAYSSVATSMPPPAPPRYAPRTAPGHRIRMNRIFRSEDGRTVIIPMDHGMIFGPLPGIVDPRATVQQAVDAHADALLLHAGLARHVADLYGGRAAGLFKITNGASVGTDQGILGSIEQALTYAADAVCLEFHLGDPAEMQTLQEISRVQREAERVGLPVVMHAYVHPTYEKTAGRRAWLHAARIAVELGADVVKTAYLGEEEMMAELLAGTPLPVVVAGGGDGSTQQLFSDVATALRLGAAGIAVGRRAWGAARPEETIAALVALVHTRVSVEEVLDRYSLV